MDLIWQKFTEWLKELLVSGIMDNVNGLFDNVNSRVAGIAGQVGATPQGWNSGVYGMIRTLSDNVILPIAGVVLAFVMTLELIQLITEKNNMHDVDTWMFFKWIFKTACAVLIVTNTWNIVMGVFEAAQSVVNSASGIIISDTSLTFNEHIAGFEAKLLDMEVWSLLGLWLESVVVHLSMWALTICIFIICYGRMIEIYCVTSIAPIPMATMAKREWGQMGQNYLRSLLALGFQPLAAVRMTVQSPKPAGAGVSGLPHHRLRGDLRGADPEHRGGEQRLGSHMDVHGVHGAAVLHAV